VTHNLELEIIIHALNMWRHYLLGKRFVLMSDYNGMNYMFDQLNLNARKARRFPTLIEFEFEINIKGKENRVVDDISIRVMVNHITVMSTYGTNLHD